MIKSGIPITLSVCQQFAQLSNDQFEVFDEWRRHRKTCRHLLDNVVFVTCDLMSWVSICKIDVNIRQSVVRLPQEVIDSYRSFMLEHS